MTEAFRFTGSPEAILALPRVPIKVICRELGAVPPGYQIAPATTADAFSDRICAAITARLDSDAGFPDGWTLQDLGEAHTWGLGELTPDRMAKVVSLLTRGETSVVSREGEEAVVLIKDGACSFRYERKKKRHGYATFFHPAQIIVNGTYRPRQKRVACVGATLWRLPVPAELEIPEDEAYVVQCVNDELPVVYIGTNATQDRKAIKDDPQQAVVARRARFEEITEQLEGLSAKGLKTNHALHASVVRPMYHAYRNNDADTLALLKWWARELFPNPHRFARGHPGWGSAGASITGSRLDDHDDNEAFCVSRAFEEGGWAHRGSVNDNIRGWFALTMGNIYQNEIYRSEYKNSQLADGDFVDIADGIDETRCADYTPDFAVRMDSLFLALGVDPERDDSVKSAIEALGCNEDVYQYAYAYYQIRVPTADLPDYLTAATGECWDEDRVKSAKRRFYRRGLPTSRMLRRRGEVGVCRQFHEHGGCNGGVWSYALQFDNGSGQMRGLEHLRHVTALERSKLFRKSLK